MNRLAKVLKCKILLTTLLWAIPSLTFPPCLLKWFGFPVETPLILLRLLGMAYTALVIGYVFGLCESRRSGYPAGVVWMGIVSNGGAFIVLGIEGAFGAWASWGGYAQILMWGSLAATGGITAGLVAFGPYEFRNSPH